LFEELKKCFADHRLLFHAPKLCHVWLLEETDVSTTLVAWIQMLSKSFALQLEIGLLLPHCQWQVSLVLDQLIKYTFAWFMLNNYYSLKQACTTYGPRKLLIWPANPQIWYILFVALIKTPFDCVKTYQLWPLDMWKFFFDPPWDLSCALKKDRSMRKRKRQNKKAPIGIKLTFFNFLAKHRIMQSHNFNKYLCMVVIC
jgi:hypothetical protein